MMKIKIDSKQKMYLESDSYQFILKKYSGKFDKDDRETYTSLGFFANLEQVIKFLYKQKINESTASTLKELLDDHKRIMREIHELFEVEGLK